jgi:hypothetical protein
MTDVRELLGTALQDEPATTIDPHAAMATGQARRRTRRQRWSTGGASAVVVLGAGLLVGANQLRPDAAAPPAAAVGQYSPSAVPLGWVRTGPTADTGLGLDVARTLPNLGGAARQVQQLLGLTASDSALPFGVPARYGALQLAYRTSDRVQVHVLLQGPEGHPIADCAGAPPAAPDDWPAAATGTRPMAPELCGDGRTVATTPAGNDRVARTVAAWGTTGGQLSVTITSDAAAPPPVTLAAARSVIGLLAGTLVFQPNPPGPDGPTPTVVPEWVATEGTADTGPYLDTGRTLANLDGAAEKVQGLLGLAATGSAHPYAGVGKFGAVQLAYRTADDVEVHVLFGGPLSPGIAACIYPLPPPTPDDWPVERAGTRPRAPSICGPDVTVATTVAAPGRVARTVAGWGTAGGQLSVTVTSDVGAAVPVPLAQVRAVVDHLAGMAVFQS